MIIKGPYPLSGLVRRSDQLLRKTSGADQWNQRISDFIGPLYWFPATTDRVVGLSLIVDRGINAVSSDPSDWEPCEYELELNQKVFLQTTKAVYFMQPEICALDFLWWWFDTCDFSLFSLEPSTHFNSDWDSGDCAFHLGTGILCCLFHVLEWADLWTLHCRLPRSIDQNQANSGLMAPDAAPRLHCILGSSDYLQR